jgi:hypothetical protein
MEQPVPTEIKRALAEADRHAYLEQRLFVYSPFGTLATTLILFALLAGTFAIAWLASGQPFVTTLGGNIVVAKMVLAGLWFSLMLSTIAGMQRYMRNKDREDIGRYAEILRGGWASAGRITEYTGRGAPLGIASAIGLVAGLGVSWFFYVWGASGEKITAYPVLLVWFLVATTIIVMSFTRGVVLTRASTRLVRNIVENELIIDLLRIDKLSVIGRSASRPALIWFTVCAVILLIFIGGQITPLNVFLLIGCAAMGLWVFVSTMEYTHQKIRAAKAVELERVRSEIAGLCRAAAADPVAAAKLQGVLAYEARIAEVQEWPFDQTTLIRVCASALILTVPWFGQAIAAYVVDHVSRIAG